MKTILASLILTLAAYAQACCAEETRISVFSQQQIFSEYSEQTIQPTWLLTGQSGQIQLMGFTQVTRVKQNTDHSSDQLSQTLGFGLHQQITPFLYTQVLVTDANGGQPAVKLGVDF